MPSPPCSLHQGASHVPALGAGDLAKPRWRVVGRADAGKGSPAALREKEGPVRRVEPGDKDFQLCLACRALQERHFAEWYTLKATQVFPPWLWLLVIQLRHCHPHCLVNGSSAPFQSLSLNGVACTLSAMSSTFLFGVWCGRAPVAEHDGLGSKLAAGKFPPRGGPSDVCS